MSGGSVVSTLRALIHYCMLASALFVGIALSVVGGACSSRAVGLPTPTVGPAPDVAVPSTADEGAPGGAGGEGTAAAATDSVVTAAPLFHSLGSPDALVTVVEFADFQ